MTDQHLAAVIVLAAGEGTRMKSAVPKVLHSIAGRSLLEHAIRAAEQLEPEHLAVVVRHKRELVAEHIAHVAPTAVVADQDEIKGTGRAAECGLEMLPTDLTGTVVVTYGDVPMLTTETLSALCVAHTEGGNAVTVMTARVPDPHGYGRIVRDESGEVAGIVEQKDATAEQQAIDEINSGIYAFDGALLREALARVGTDNAQGEKYLTDVLGIARGLGRTVAAFETDDLWQTEGVNDRVQLARMGAELNRRLCEKWMRAGVTIIDPPSTWIDSDVSIGPDTTIHPDTQLRGATTIGANATIGPDVTLVDSEVGNGARVWRTDGEAVEVGPSAKVGPYVHLRANTTVGEGAVIEGFVVTIDTDIEAAARVGSFTALGHSAQEGNRA